MKMYLLIADDVPDNFVPVCAAHASLACYLKFRDNDMQEWLDQSFRKVVCRVSRDDFALAAALDRAVVMSESALNDMDVAVALAPRKEWPEFIQKVKLWKPKDKARVAQTVERWPESPEVGGSKSPPSANTGCQ